MYNKTSAVQLASLLIIVAKTLFSQLFFLLNKLLFVSGRQWVTGRWWRKQWLAKYGPLIRLNSTNGPHCLKEFDFLPFCVHAVSLSGARLQQRGPYQQHSGCGIEELSSASNQTMRKSDRERAGARRRRERWREEGRGSGENLQMLPLSHLDMSHTRTLARHVCTCTRTRDYIQCTTHACCINTHGRT